MQKHLSTTGIIILLAIPLFFLAPFFRDLLIPDEPRYTEIAMDMAKTGNWFVPHYQGELYSEKPPLFFWLLAASAKLLGGWYPFAMILPAILAAVGCLIVTYRFALFLFQQRIVALLSALVLMTSGLFVGVGQTVRMDTILLFCISLSLWCFYRLFASTATAHNWLYAMVFFLAAGIGTLTKGPVAIGLPGLIITIFLSWNRFYRHQSGEVVPVLKKMHLFWGMLLYLTIVLLWLIPAISQQGWAYAYLILIKQNFGRVYSDWAPHARPWYFYLYTFPWISLPWFPFFVSARVTQRSVSVAPQEQQALTFLWVWWSTTFVFFSIVSGKLEIYLLPLFPPTAMIIGRLWGLILASNDQENRGFRPITYPTYVLAGVLGIAAVVVMAISQTRQYSGGALLLVLFSFLLIAFAVKRYTRIMFGMICSFTFLVLFYGLMYLIPALSQQLTLQPVVHDLERFGLTEGSFATWQTQLPVQYYLPVEVRILETPEEKRTFFASKTPAYCLIREKYVDQFRQELPIPIYVLGTYQIQNKQYVLISQYPAEALPLKS